MMHYTDLVRDAVHTSLSRACSVCIDMPQFNDHEHYVTTYFAKSWAGAAAATNKRAGKLVCWLDVIFSTSFSQSIYEEGKWCETGDKLQLEYWTNFIRTNGTVAWLDKQMLNFLFLRSLYTYLGVVVENFHATMKGSYHNMVPPSRGCKWKLDAHE